MKTIRLVVGLVGVLLGGLWLLQGLGIVHIRPILCFADCAPVQEPSASWTAIGAVVLVAGAMMAAPSRRGGRS